MTLKLEQRGKETNENILTANRINYLNWTLFFWHNEIWKPIDRNVTKYVTKLYRRLSVKYEDATNAAKNSNSNYNDYEKIDDG